MNLTDTEKEQMYHDHLHIAERTARLYSRKFKCPIADARDNANFALALLIYNNEIVSYDPEKQTLEGWFYVRLNWHLREVYTRGRHPHCPSLREPQFYREIPSSEEFVEMDMKEVPETLKVDALPWLNRFLAGLTEEGAEIVRVILNAPAEIVNALDSNQGRTAADKQKTLYEYLVDDLDKQPTQTACAFLDIKRELAKV